MGASNARSQTRGGTNRGRGRTSRRLVPATPQQRGANTRRQNRVNAALRVPRSLFR